MKSELGSLLLKFMTVEQLEEVPAKDLEVTFKKLAIKHPLPHLNDLVLISAMIDFNYSNDPDAGYYTLH